MFLSGKFSIIILAFLDISLILMFQILQVNINKQKKEAFQIIKPDLDVDPESNPHFDERMGVNKAKLLRPKRMSFQFVDEGKWTRDAEHIKLKVFSVAFKPLWTASMNSVYLFSYNSYFPLCLQSKFGEAQAKEHKAKQAQLAKAKAAPDINPNLIEVSERVITKEKPREPIPEVEWW